MLSISCLDAFQDVRGAALFSSFYQKLQAECFVYLGCGLLRYLSSEHLDSFNFWSTSCLMEINDCNRWFLLLLLLLKNVLLYAYEASLLPHHVICWCGFGNYMDHTVWKKWKSIAQSCSLQTTSVSRALVSTGCTRWLQGTGGGGASDRLWIRPQPTDAHQPHKAQKSMLRFF